MMESPDLLVKMDALVGATNELILGSEYPPCGHLE